MNLVQVFNKFPTQEKCIEYLELKRWKEGVKCVYCGSNKTCKHISGESKRHQCWNCNKSFSVLVKTIFEDTNLPLQKWFLAISLMANAKKGISALQLSRDIEVSYKTAWNITRKIRKAMKDDNSELLCGIVQLDDTYIKTKKDDDDKRDGGSKKKLNNTPVVAISSEGKIRAAKVDDIKSNTLLNLALENIQREATLHTDSAKAYFHFKQFFNHKTVKHNLEFVSPKGVHTNGVETFWSLLKRGIRGNFHHISKKYLQDYINEFQFRFNRRAFTGEVIFEEIIEKMLKI